MNARIHFCTLNLSEATLKIFRNLKRGERTLLMK